MQAVTQHYRGFSGHTARPQRSLSQLRVLPEHTPRRKPLQQRQASERDSDLQQLDSLKGDLDRLKAKQQAAGQSQQVSSSPQAASAPESTLKGLVDKVLIADFFFVCLALAWLAAGVAEKTSLNSSKLLDAWYPLWNLVFQPAIGVLMLGALVSGGMGWLKGRKAS